MKVCLESSVESPPASTLMKFPFNEDLGSTEDDAENHTSDDALHKVVSDHPGKREQDLSEGIATPASGNGAQENSGSSPPQISPEKPVEKMVTTERTLKAELIDVDLHENIPQTLGRSSYSPPKVPGVEIQEEFSRSSAATTGESQQTAEKGVWKAPFLRKVNSRSQTAEPDQYKELADEITEAKATQETKVLQNLKGLFPSTKKKSSNDTQVKHLASDLSLNQPFEKEEQLLPGEGNRQHQFKLTFFEKAQRGYFANEDDSDGENAQCNSSEMAHPSLPSQYAELSDGYKPDATKSAHQRTPSPNLHRTNRSSQPLGTGEDYVMMEDPSSPTSNRPSGTSQRKYQLQTSVKSLFRNKSQPSMTQKTGLEEELTNFTPAHDRKSSFSKTQNSIHQDFRSNPKMAEAAYIALSDSQDRPRENSFLSEFSEKTKRFFIPTRLRKNRSTSTLGGAQSDITDESYYFLAEDLDDEIYSSGPTKKSSDALRKFKQAFSIDKYKNDRDKAKTKKGAGCGRLDGTRFAAGQLGPEKPCGVAPSHGDWDTEPEIKLQAVGATWSLRAEIAALENRKKKAEEDLTLATQQRNEAYAQHEKLMQKYSVLLEASFVLEDQMLSQENVFGGIN